MARTTKAQQSHDRYFRDILEDTEIAREFLQAFMNSRAQEGIDWSTLEVYDTALFGENNKALYADVIYRAQTYAQEDIFFIINHETKLDWLLSIRKLEYKLGTLRKTVKQKKQPALIYFLTWQSGALVPADYPRSIADYFRNPTLAKALFLEDDIIVAQELSDEKLLQSGKASVLTIFMKYASSPQFPDWIEKNKEIVEILAENKYIDRSIEYLLEVGYHDEEALKKAFTKSSEKLKQKMLTTKQRIEKKSMQRGMEQERFSIARNMLHQLRLGTEVVKQATGLSDAELFRLAKG